MPLGHFGISGIARRQLLIVFGQQPMRGSIVWIVVEGIAQPELAAKTALILQE